MDFATLQTFSTWLESTRLSSAINNYPWIWPMCETLHFIGLALLVGIVGLVDLRMLGIVKQVPFAPLYKLLPWAVLGFVINVVTGILFFIGIPSQYVENSVFWYKMLFIVLAGINVLVFYLTAFKEAEQLGSGEPAPLKVKAIAAISLFLWVGVMYWGRMLPFIGDAF